MLFKNNLRCNNRQHEARSNNFNNYLNQNSLKNKNSMKNYNLSLNKQMESLRNSIICAKNWN